MNAIDRSNLAQVLSEVVVILLISVSVVAPAIVLSSTLPYFKVEQLLLPAILFVYAWMLLAGVSRSIRINALFAVGLLYSAANLLSIWYGSSVLGHSVIGRDFYELPKAWLPVAFFTIGYEARFTESSFRRLISALAIPVLLVCVYGWCQFAGLGFTYRLNSLYSSGGHIDLGLRYAQRVYATMGNPNVLGELMVWCSLLFLLAFVNRAGSRLVNLCASVACLITLAMTGSRFGLVSAALGLVIIFALLSYSSRRELAKLALLLLFLPVVAWTYDSVATSNRRTFERYETLRTPLEIDSLRQRLDDLWKQEWADFTESPIVGHGPAKAVFTLGYTDSEYLEVLRGEGLLGIVLFLGYYLVPLYLIGKGLRTSRNYSARIRSQLPATMTCTQFGILLGLLALFMDIPMSTFYNPFLQGFVWLWFGVSACASARFRLVEVTWENSSEQVGHLTAGWEVLPTPEQFQN